MQIKNFSILNKKGESYLTTWNTDNCEVCRTIKDRQNKNLQQKIFSIINSYERGIKWEYKNNEIIIIDNNPIIGCPSLDMQYVIAIYIGKEAEYQPPANAVIYNADGSIHKVLQVPLLISDSAKSYGLYRKQPNKTIHFSNVDWKKDKNGNSVLVMEISETLGYVFKEYRILNPETGEFGDCYDSRLEYK